MQTATRSAQGPEEGLRKNSGRAYHSLDSEIIENVICVAVIDDGTHASVDDRLEVWTCRSHPVTGRGELVVYVRVGLNPCTLRANFRRHC